MIGEGGLGELQSYGSACSLLESGLAETLTVHVDWRGNIVAVNLAVRSQEAAFKVGYRRLIPFFFNYSVDNDMLRKIAIQKLNVSC